MNGSMRTRLVCCCALLLAAACGREEPADTAPPPVSVRGDVAFAYRTWGGDELVTADLAEWPNNRGPGVAVVDLDGDGWLDVFLALPLGASRVLRNDGGDLALDDGFTADGGALPAALAVAAGDLDGDGDADVVLSGERDVPDRVLWNDGQGAFSVEELPNSEGESKSVTLVDVDGNGALDILIAGFVPFPSADLIADGVQVGDGNHLYVRGPDGRWIDDLPRLPSLVSRALTYQFLPIDADGDGDLDLYMVNDYGPQLIRNGMLLNDGAGYFSLDDDCTCDLSIKGMGAGVGDQDGDGWPDIAVTDVGNPHLLRNAGDGSFFEVGTATGVPGEHEPGTSWGAAFVDLDLDGPQELVIVYGAIFAMMGTETDGDLLLHGEPDGSYTDISAALDGDARIARVVAVGDLDRDGRPDLVTAGIAWLAVRYNQGAYAPGATVVLDAPDHGIGARLDVVAGEQSYTRWMLPSTMYGSSAPEVVLGHGDAMRLDVTVTWADGSTTTRSGLARGERVLISPGG
jgi:hypothetical protein